jgi:hypothetical protein
MAGAAANRLALARRTKRFIIWKPLDAQAVGQRAARAAPQHVRNDAAWLQADGSGVTLMLHMLRHGDFAAWRW